MPFLNSSAIYQVEYNAETQVLSIIFQKGRKWYYYYGVPESVYRGLLSAPSAGQYFDTYIKDQYSAR